MKQEVREAVQDALRALLPEIAAVILAATPARADEGWVSIPRAAQLSGFAEDVLRRHIAGGRLRATLPEGSTHYRVALGDLRRWIDGGVEAPISIEARVAASLAERCDK